MTDPHEMQPFFSVFQSETDRACAILAACLLDDSLQKLISTAMIVGDDKLFVGNGPLSTFSSKIDIAYEFGMISNNEKRDAHLIRKIRNEFAHSLTHDMSFVTQVISQRVSELSQPKILFEHPTLTINPDTPRTRFEIAVGILYFLFRDIRPKATNKPIAPEAYAVLDTKPKAD